ncbi:hypothetical protein CLV41_10388 [Roseibium marinum]|uniref:Uncharacterized protein n=1 Tax=Roseibium marinum TaxID=281252 RepID=A0A2S3UXI3_9HYPH|nr:hypothetical protein CLV41_10388 [Roseibium marinum]
MGTSNFSDAFNWNAVAQITRTDRPIARFRN